MSIPKHRRRENPRRDAGARKPPPSPKVLASDPDPEPVAREIPKSAGKADRSARAR